MSMLAAQTHLVNGRCGHVKECQYTLWIALELWCHNSQAALSKEMREDCFQLLENYSYSIHHELALHPQPHFPENEEWIPMWLGECEAMDKYSDACVFPLQVVVSFDMLGLLLAPPSLRPFLHRLHLHLHFVWYDSTEANSHPCCVRVDWPVVCESSQLYVSGVTNDICRKKLMDWFVEQGVWFTIASPMQDTPFLMAICRGLECGDTSLKQGPHWWGP